MTVMFVYVVCDFVCLCIWWCFGVCFNVCVLVYFTYMVFPAQQQQKCIYRGVQKNIAVTITTTIHACHSNNNNKQLCHMHLHMQA